jgi:SAM-dependent methyltransferase
MSSGERARELAMIEENDGQTVEMRSAPPDTYADYILRTGTGVVGELELVLGAHWYQTRFTGKAPILDLGSGRCWFTRQNVKGIVAVDNSRELVEHFRQEGINNLHGDAYNIPVGDEHFEGVFCCWLLEHLAEPDRALREMHRVLKPGGYACVIVPTPHDMEAFYADYTHVRPYTKISLKQLAEDAGFSRHQTAYFPCIKGILHVIKHLGVNAGRTYLRFADTYLRKIRVVNKNNLILEAWK